MTKVLIDYNGAEINIGDIIARENLETKELTYFLYQEEEDTKSRGVLYKYDKNGNIDEKTIMNNLYMGQGIDIISNYNKRWIRLGTKEEAYDRLFGK